MKRRLHLFALLTAVTMVAACSSEDGAKVSTAAVQGERVKYEKTSALSYPYPTPVAVDADEEKFRYVDAEGNTVIPGPFNWVGSFMDGYAYVRDENDNTFVIDPTGKKQFDTDYLKMGRMLNGMMAFQEEGDHTDELRQGFVNTRGDVVFKPVYYHVTDFAEDRALALYPLGVYSWELRMLYPDGESKVVKGIDVQEGTRLTSFSNGFAVVAVPEGEESYGANKLYTIDRDGNITGDEYYQDLGSLEEGLIPYLQVDEAFGSVWGYLGKDAKPAIGKQFLEAEPFSEGRAFAVFQKDCEGCGTYEDGETVYEYEEPVWSVIDRSGKKVGDQMYDEASAFHNGLAAVEVDGLYGYIDRNGKMIIEPQYNFASSFFQSELAQVTKDEKTYYINKKGKTVITLD